ncbi:ATP-dependent translocase ABCB1-like isoform X2 [Scylla paramamosain]
MDTKSSQNGHPVIINVASEKGSLEDLENEKHETHVQIQATEEGSPKKKKKISKDGGEEDKNKPLPVPFSSLFRYSNSKERCIMASGVLAAMLSGVCLPAMFILFGDLTNSFVYHAMLTNITNETLQEYNDSFANLPIVINENTTVEDVRDQLTEFLGIGDFFEGVVRFGVGTFLVGFVQMLMGYIFVTSMNYAAEGQVFRLRGMFLRSILSQEIAWFDTHQTNDFASRVTEDLNKLQEGIGEKVGMFIFFMTTFLASLINAFVHGWELTLIILSVFPLLGISTGLIAKVTTSLTSAELQKYGKAGSIAEEVLSSIRTVLAFGGEAKEIKRYEDNLVYARNAGVKRGLMTGVGVGVMWLFIYAAYALAFWYGTGLILDSRAGNGDYDPSKLIIVFFSVLMGAMNVGQSAPYWEAFTVARGAAATIFSIVERKSAIDPSSKEGKMPHSITGTIELRDVHFSYPSRPDVKVLQGVSLKVEPGQTVALVGSSGCGKSTCIQLIQRFYDTASGDVMLDGQLIQDLNIGWLRDQIGVVGQEPVLFGTTIAENIRYGRDGVSMAEIEAAAKEANAHDFIMKLPKKYETQVGDRGVQMSGGQKQRVAIARALVKQPRILLLDEATSALDNQSEAIVQQALDKVRRGRTTVIVAHRLSTIRSADKIVAFNKGLVAEVGTHKELMKHKSFYYNLVTAQIPPSERKSSKADKEDVESDSSDEENVISVAELSQDIMDDLVSKSPVALARTSSTRQSLRRRRTSTKASRHSKETEKEKENLPTVPLSRIMKMNSTEWPYMLAGALGSAIQGTIVPLYAIMFGEVLGSLSTADEVEARKQGDYYAVLFLIIGLIAAVSMFVQAYMFALSGETLTSRMRKLTFAAMLRQEVGWFDEEKNSVGALCSRLSGDAASVQGATGSRIGTIIQALTTLGVSICLALYYDWRLGLISFPFIPFVLIAVYLQSKILMGQSVTESESLQDAGKLAIECITNIRTVASLHKEQYFADEYSAALLKPHLQALKKSHLRGIAFGFAQAVPFFAYATTMLYGGHLVDVGQISYEDVFKVAEALILGTMMVGQAVAFAPNYSKARVAASQIFHLLDRHPQIDSSAGTGLRLSGDISTIELQGVHFVYPTRPDTTILQGLGVRVDRGKTLALVGSSGCGKSTIISLLERFYNAQKGTVTINGQDIEALNVGWVRQQLGLVSQEPVLFDLTIEENIAYGDNTRRVEHHEVVAAAKKANIHAFIESLPDKYNTKVGAKGTQLSGGQKQRVAIARALVRNPSVLLLDEATSALDTESEKVVQEALEQAQAGRTSIVIAHRLSTIQGADTIAVIQAGQVVEVGTHSELMEKKGHYYSLYQTNH